MISEELLDKFCEAIARAEGFYEAGTVPRRSNNPGDLTDEGDKGLGTIQTEGPNGAKITIYATPADGWAALRRRGVQPGYRPHRVRNAEGPDTPAGTAASAGVSVSPMCDSTLRPWGEQFGIVEQPPSFGHHRVSPASRMASPRLIPGGPSRRKGLPPAHRRPRRLVWRRRVGRVERRSPA